MWLALHHLNHKWYTGSVGWTSLHVSLFIINASSLHCVSKSAYNLQLISANSAFHLQVKCIPLHHRSISSGPTSLLLHFPHICQVYSNLKWPYCCHPLQTSGKQGNLKNLTAWWLSHDDYMPGSRYVQIMRNWSCTYVTYFEYTLFRAQDNENQNLNHWRPPLNTIETFQVRLLISIFTYVAFD